ncbi:MAG TPA: OsmC family protein [Terriglobia bacterium]
MEVKKAFKSFRYPATVVWTAARRGRGSTPGKPEIEVGSPPEFRGEESVWSPEHLFVTSLNTCLMLTFLSLAERRRLEVAAYQSSAEGLLENVDGRYKITAITVRPQVTLKSETALDAAREIMGKVEENCFISNSITSKVDLQAEFRVA